jgi:hypothetical protein
VNTLKLRLIQGEGVAHRFRYPVAGTLRSRILGYRRGGKTGWSFDSCLLGRDLHRNPAGKAMIGVKSFFVIDCGPSTAMTRVVTKYSRQPLSFTRLS